jgi:hypothetical protein
MKTKNIISINFFFQGLIFFVIFLSSSYISTFGIDPHHDGIMLKPALDVSRGLVLFKDTFTQYGALSTFIQAFALKVFGEYLLVLKLLTALFYGLIAVLLYQISIKFLPKVLAFAGIILWFLLAPYNSFPFYVWSSVYALFFQLLATLYLINALDKYSPGKIFLAGVFTSFVFWSRQPVGVFTFFAVVAYFIFQLVIKNLKLKNFKKYLINYVWGNILVCLIFFTYLILSSSLNDWWTQSIIFSYSWGKIYTGNYNIFRLLYFLFDTVDPKSLINIWTLIPITTLLLFIKYFKHKTLALLFFIGLASWQQYYPLNDQIHLFWAATPMLPLFSLFVYQLFKNYLFTDFHFSSNISKYAAIFLIFIIFLPDIIFSTKNVINKLSGNYVFLQYPKVLRGMRIYDLEATYYNNTYQEIQKYFLNNPNGNLINNGRDAIYNTFDKRIKNVHPIYINWTQISQSIYPEYSQLLTQYIEKNHPLIISTTEDIPQNYCQVKINNPSNINTGTISQFCSNNK